MAAHSERMERFENTIFKQREEINDRMAEMFKLPKELMTSRAPEKVLIREEAKFPVTKNVNSISLAKGEEERSNKKIVTLDTHWPELGSIGGLKHVNALIDQGSDVNIMPYSTYMKLTDEMPAETDIMLSLASHLYIYPLGIAEDVLVKVAEHVYPVDFMILDIKENEKRPFILGTPLPTMAKTAIKFNKGILTLRSGKSKISFYQATDSTCITEKGVKNNIEPINPHYDVNRLVIGMGRNR
ncbi:MAK10-like protein [Tanacetum coccineum]